MADPRCTCPMFKTQGTCYHTGYKPEFKGNLFGRITAAAERAVKAYKVENESPPKMLTKAERVRKANELREQAAELERA